MPYLNLDLDYFTHPKVVRLVGLLGLEHVAVPIRLWCYVGKYHPATGMLEVYSIGEIESAVNWAGEPGQLVEVLVKIKFIEKIKNGYRIHDWLEHAGHLVAFKKRAKSAAKVRWEHYATSNASRTPNRKITNAPILTNPILPNQLIKKSKSVTHAMPDDWSLTDGMKSYGLKKGMGPLTLEHEFEHCKTHHQESRFTERGWATKTWQTWVLSWITYGSKQVTSQSAPPPQAKCQFDIRERCEDYAVPGSKYCQKHRDYFARLRDKAVPLRSVPESETVDVSKLLTSLSHGKAM